MLYNKNDSQSYEKEFKKRFTNFCEKSPVLISMNVSPTCVQVVDESTDNVYEFPWDYTLTVKEFIHAIKEILVKSCYPVIIKTETTIEDVSIDEQSEMIANGVSLDKVPTKREIKKERKFLIDKIIVYRDIFLIKDMETGVMSRYKLNKSAIFFLKKLRNEEFTSVEAGNFFFDKATLLNVIEEIA
jgi:hypothetical protein